MSTKNVPRDPFPATIGKLPGEWIEDALCAEVDHDVFFAERGKVSETKRARLICAACPVRQPCLQYALDLGNPEGVWGGLTQLQRSKLRRGVA